MAKKARSQTQSAFTLFSKSSTLVTQNLGLFIVASIISLAQPIYALVQKPVDIVDPKNIDDILKLVGLTPLTLAIVAIVGIVMAAVLPKLATEVAKGKKPQLGDLWSYAVRYTFPILALSIVSGLAVLGGFILLLVPGFILLRKFYLAPYILVDQDTGIIESLKKSSQLTGKAPMSIWGLVGVSILLGIPSIVTVYGVGPIVSAVLAMLFTVAPALRYNELKKLK